MASPLQYVSVTTTAANTTLTGTGSCIVVKSLDGAGIVAARVDGTAADATGAEGNFYLAALAGDVVVIPVSVRGSIVISLDATATTKVALWLDQLDD